MELTIREYDDRFLIEQVKMVNKLQKNWEPRPFLQTVKNYRQSFTGDTFHPQLNLYGFIAGELVGIVNSQINGDKLNIQPFVYPEYLDELIPILERLKKILRKEYPKISHLTTIGGPGWNNRLQLIEKLGFVEHKPNFVSTTRNATNLTLPQFVNSDRGKIVPYDEEIHYETLLDLFVKRFSFPRDFIAHEIKEMYKLKNLIISWRVAIKDGAVIGHGLLIFDKPNHNYAFIREILTENDDQELFNQIYSALIRDLQGSEREILNITIRVRQSKQNHISYFQDLGFNFETYHSYILSINPT